MEPDNIDLYCDRCDCITHWSNGRCTKCTQLFSPPGKSAMDRRVEKLEKLFETQKETIDSTVDDMAEEIKSLKSRFDELDNRIANIEKDYAKKLDDLQRQLDSMDRTFSRGKLK